MNDDKPATIRLLDLLDLCDDEIDVIETYTNIDREQLGKLTTALYNARRAIERIIEG